MLAGTLIASKNWVRTRLKSVIRPLNARLGGIRTIDSPLVGAANPSNQDFVLKRPEYYESELDFSASQRVSIHTRRGGLTIHIH